MSKFEIYKGKGEGEEVWRWRLIDDNGEKIARSEEAFVKRSIKRSIKTIKMRVNIDTPVLLDGSKEDKNKGYRFEYFQSDRDKKKWYWRLKASNHQIMATGGQGFRSKRNILGSIENVKEEIGRAEILLENKG